MRILAFQTGGVPPTLGHHAAPDGFLKSVDCISRGWVGTVDRLFQVGPDLTSIDTAFLFRPTVDSDNDPGF